MELPFLLLLWGLSDSRIAELHKIPRSFSIKLHSETQVSGRLGMSRGRSPRHAQNPLSGEWRKTLSITHHALSPPPWHHHLYIIHLINWHLINVFIVSQCHLKDHLCRKVLWRIQNVSSPSTRKTLAGFFLRILCLEGSVISPSSGGSPGPINLYVHKGGLKPD